MFMSIKSKTIIYAFSVLLAISIAVVFVSIKEVNDNHTKPVTAPESKIILIDAGHGGFDAGASANGISEKDINLSVAQKLKDIISQNGGTAIMTRDSDTSTADENRSDGSSAKKSDLIRRKEMVKECNADIFVSIHMNKFPQEKYYGAQVFYASSPDDSRYLGENIQSALIRNLNDGNTRVAKKAENNIFILKNAEVPSVIVECGFLSNPQEAEKLKSDEYRAKLSSAIYDGICDFFSNQGTPQ